MTERAEHRVTAWWASGRTGIAKSGSAPQVIHFTAPPGFGGVEGRWTPEDLFLAALASCYTTTFRTITEHSKFAYTDLEVTAEGSVKKANSGYVFSEIVIHAHLIVTGNSEEALLLLKKAWERCLVSRAVSVPQKLEPRVLIQTTSPG